MNCYMKQCFVNWPSYGRWRKRLVNSWHQHMLLQTVKDATRLDVRNPVSRQKFMLTSKLITLAQIAFTLTWRIWWAPNNVSKSQMGFNSAFKGLMVSPGFFCRLVCSFILSSVIYYEKFCLYVATNFFCIPVICPKLGKHLVPVQTLGLFYVLSKCIPLFFSYIFHLSCCCYSFVSSFNGIRGSDRLFYPTVITTFSWYTLFSQTRQWRPRQSGVTVSSGKEVMPSQNIPVQRLKAAILPLYFPCSGFVTHSGEILTTRKSQKKPDGLLLTYLLTHFLTPWSTVVLDKLSGFQLVKKFSASYCTRRFITAVTSARHLSLSWASSIKSTYPRSTTRRSILILSSHLCVGFLSGLFPSGFPTKTLYTPLLFPIRTTCPANLILQDFITRTIFDEEYRSLSSSLCSFLHSLVTSSLLGPNILLNTLFSNTLSLRSSLNASD